MTEDARNSLFAFACVTIFVAASVVFLWLMKGVELPGWTPYAVLGLNLLHILIITFRWQRGRWRRRRDHGTPS